MSATLSELQRRFLALSQITRITKSSSYHMGVSIDANEDVYASIHGYDIPSFPRHCYLGPFKTMEAALDALAAKVTEAEVEVHALQKAGHGF
jgi:hypothetical protein